MRQALRQVASGLAIALLTATAVWAQAGATAQISGTVRDSSGAVLPGVDVTATQTDTNFVRSTVTDAGGNVLNLPTGPLPIAGDSLRIPHIPAHWNRSPGQR